MQVWRCPMGRIRSVARCLRPWGGQLQAVNEALRPVPVEWGFGLGWDDVHQGAFATSDIRAWRKNGGTLVYGSDFYVLPDHELAVMITGTSTAYKPDAIAEQVLYQALVEKGSLARMPEFQVEGAIAAFVYDADLAPVYPDQFRASPDGVVRAEDVSGTVLKPARVRVPKGGLVLLYGEPGSVVSVTAAV
jgi:hypothetical protein